MDGEAQEHWYTKSIMLTIHEQKQSQIDGYLIRII